MEINIVANLIIEELPSGFEISIFANNSAPLLKRILYIYHPLKFKKDQAKI